MQDVGESVARAAGETPGAWGGRRRGRGVWRRPVTSGAQAGTSGARAWLLARAYAVILLLLALNAAITVATKLEDARRMGHALTAREVIVWEATSVVAALVASVVILAALRLAPLRPGRVAIALAVHACATAAYSAVHVTLMVLMRMALYAAAGSAYRFSLAEFPYEYRKDLIGYIALGGVFWVAARLGRAAPPPRAEAKPVTFDIVDGASVLRTPVRDILAARAAGNYVEFALADGRKPLMRAPLGKVEAQLSPFGFVRTHRSWIVNGERVRVIEAAGSGDFRVEIDGGLSAPISRRFPEALKQLRNGSG